MEGFIAKVLWAPNEPEPEVIAPKDRYNAEVIRTEAQRQQINTALEHYNMSIRFAIIDMRRCHDAPLAVEALWEAEVELLTVVGKLWQGRAGTGTGYNTTTELIRRKI